ncbi:hypothetical protein PHLCEN_2v5364 [Hermanssonia centrifuga]|uniref:Uncharacterized protein n=1 Tax=Hermanssonia centrifuga TaxID=98765 RepID=A0A2R6P5E5_9APHY|nr:hypothetical protein PHLCEN_2v5364 [Hermanssonia centrifuga]
MNAYSSYKIQVSPSQFPSISTLEFDFLITHSPARAYNVSQMGASPFSAGRLHDLPMHEIYMGSIPCNGNSLIGALITLVKSIPAYHFFDKRIAAFDFDPRGTSVFFSVRVLGDTSRIRAALLHTQPNIVTAREPDQPQTALTKGTKGQEVGCSVFHILYYN